MYQFISNDVPKAVYRLQYGIHHNWNGLRRWNLILLDSCVLALRRDNQKRKDDTDFLHDEKFGSLQLFKQYLRICQIWMIPG